MSSYSSADSNTLQEGNSSTHSKSLSNPNNGSTRSEERPTTAPPLVVREEDKCLPIANVIRIMQQILPPHAEISDEAKETIQESVSKYISFITGKANEWCRREKRKIVTASDLLLAMEELGFNDYVEPLTVFLDRYLQDEGNRLMHRGGIVPMQQRVANDGMPPPQTSLVAQKSYPIGMGALYKDGSSVGGSGASGSGSGNAMTNFDPIAYLNRDHFLDD